MSDAEKAWNNPAYLNQIIKQQVKEIDRLAAVISQGWSSRDKYIAELEAKIKELENERR